MAPVPLTSPQEPNAAVASRCAPSWRVRLTRRSPAIVLALFAVLNLAAGLGCSEEQLRRTPVLAADPAAFLFAKQEVGDSQTRRVELVNRGNLALVVRGLRLRDNSSAGEFSLHVLDASGARVEALPSVITVAPDGSERVTLVVTYTPQDDDGVRDAAEVLFETNDPSQLSVVIPVVSGGQGAELLISPSTVTFDGRVTVGTTVTEDVLLQNIGVSDLIIDDLRVDGAVSQVKLEVIEPDQRSVPLEGPWIIPPQGSGTVRVSYTPTSLAGLSGTEMVIISNDVQATERRVPITGTSGASCINVLPDPIEFGSALIVEDRNGETPNVIGVTFESCGAVELRVDRIEFEAEAFGFTTVFEPEEADGGWFVLPGKLPGDSLGPTRTLQLGFWPLAERAYGGRMRVFTSASPEPINVDLFGRGVRNSCPVPATTTETYNVPPLEVVTLDGTPSTDPGGAVERWEWTVVGRPDGSTSQVVEEFDDPVRPANGGIEDNPATPQARFFVDLAGRYEIELRVYDNLGQVSCDPLAVARVVIEAVPSQDLHVQMVWATPADPDESDLFGTDVDLHLRHQRGLDAWGEAAGPWDCNFRNKTPDWGVPGDPSDDPSLDIDDLNGAGPENINLSDPEEGVRYDIAAIYFRAESTFGVAGADPRAEHLSLVTLRIYVRGELLFELIDRELTTEGQLWHAAQVTWCAEGPACPVVTPVDRVLSFDEWFRP